MASPDDETIAVTQTPGLTVPGGDRVLPHRLGPVRLIREIGRGGMGVVWLGHDELLGRDVAVKLLLNAVSGPDDPGFSRFLEGARAAARIRHLGLTTLHQADLINGLPYLVMDFVDGPTLFELIRSNGPLSPAALMQVLRPVCDALGELHDRDLVHRDIKPANILVNADGEVFVTDFGLACERTPPGSAPGSRRMAGTPTYMAPEMFEGVVSLRSDVYALGVTAFEMLSGNRPFQGTPEELREKHGCEPLPVEALRERNVSADLITALERATHKNAMFRYKSARLFLRALQEATHTDTARSPSADLAHLVDRCRAGPRNGTADPPTPSTPSSYFDRLAELAVQKKGHREPGSESLSQNSAVHKPLETEVVLRPQSGGPSPEAAVTVRENPLLNLYLRGLPEMELFESDLQRRLALTDLHRTREGGRWRWRFFRSRRFWLDVGAATLIVFAVIENMKLILKRLAMPAPLGKIVSFVVIMAAFWFVNRRNARRWWQEPLRLKLLEQGVPVCLGCGYLLRGLPLESARCPECGRPFDERVRELLNTTAAGSGLPGAGSTPLMPELQETQAIKVRRRARATLVVAGSVMILAAGLASGVADVYPAMQSWSSRAVMIGFGMLGIILALIGSRRYRISP